MEDLLFLTELIGLKVYDLRGRKIGRVRDAALVPLIHSQRVDRFLVGGGWAWLSIRHDQIARISLEGIFLRDENLTPYHAEEYMLRLVRDLLDQQIIDAQGRKVVRVTDVTFQVQRREQNETLLVDDIDIGLRSIFRRVLQGVVPSRWVRFLQQPIPPNSIPWQYCNVLETDPQRRLRLNISNKLLEEMHPADLADIFEELGPEDREAIISSIDSEVAADTLSELEPEMQASIVENLEPVKAAEIVEEMSPDEAADLLRELESETSDEILEEMEDAPASDVEELLEYPSKSAGGMMNTEYIALPLEAKVRDAIAAIRLNEDSLDALHAIFLIDAEERLLGSVPIARLFLAEGSQSLRELATMPARSAHVQDRQARITEKFDKYNLLVLPVIDNEGKLRGVITADDIISVLRQE